MAQGLSESLNGIVSWATKSVGQKYGSGYDLEVNARRMERLLIGAPWTGNRDA